MGIWKLQAAHTMDETRNNLGGANHIANLTTMIAETKITRSIRGDSCSRTTKPRSERWSRKRWGTASTTTPTGTKSDVTDV